MHKELLEINNANSPHEHKALQTMAKKVRLYRSVAEYIAKRAR